MEITGLSIKNKDSRKRKIRVYDVEQLGVTFELVIDGERVIQMRKRYSEMLNTNRRDCKT